VDNFSNLVTLLNAGIKACRDILLSAKIMLHLDNGGNNQLYVNWFDKYFLNGGLDFDYIGLSYYMFWHGTLEDLKNNLNDLANRYNKEMIVAETSYGFTMEDYDEYEELEERTGMILNQKLIECLPFEISKQGQCEYIKTLMKLIDSIDKDLCKGFIYWGAESIPVNGCGWANQTALKYINENGPGGNSWANQALFDYDGNALPILETIKDYNFKK
jgi:arabinogalactan endo-1,4-beta-galactosidase